MANKYNLWPCLYRFSSLSNLQQAINTLSIAVYGTRWFIADIMRGSIQLCTFECVCLYLLCTGSKTVRVVS